MTARNEALAALRQSERRLRAIVENALEGIVIVDNDALIETANPAMCTIAGRVASELVGTRFDELIGSDAFENVRSTLSAHHALSNQEFTIRQSEGAPVAVELSAVADVLPGRHP